MFDPTNQIHPTAVLEGHVQLGANNVIGPFAVLRGDISLGSHNTIGPGVVLEHAVEMGNHNQLSACVCVGGIGEMGRKGDRRAEGGRVIIGHGCTLREHVVVHGPVHTAETFLDDGVYLMNHAYVAHDVRLGRRVVLSHGASLGGRVIIDDDVTVGMQAAIHQRCRIGRGAMIGMLTVVIRPVLPFAKVAGNPARILGANVIGAQTLGLDDVAMEALEAYFRHPVRLEQPGNTAVIAEIWQFLQDEPDALMATKQAS